MSPVDSSPYLALMLSFSVTPLILVALASTGGDVNDSSAPIPALEIQGRDDARVEYFAIRSPRVAAAGPAIGTGPVEASAPVVIGVAKLVASESADLELLTEFFEIQTRVSHVEHSANEVVRLVHREIRARAGRTLVLEGGPTLGWLRSTDWAGGPEAERRSLPDDLEVGLPLTLLEELRIDQTDSAGRTAERRVFDPLANRVEAVSVESAALSLAGHPLLRTVRLARSDGTILWSWTFAGSALVGFTRQDGGPVAQRVSKETWERLVQQGRGPGEVPPE